MANYGEEEKCSTMNLWATRVTRLSNKTLRIQAIYSIKHRPLKFAKAYSYWIYLSFKVAKLPQTSRQRGLLVCDDISISIIESVIVNN